MMDPIETPRPGADPACLVRPARSRRLGWKAGALVTLLLAVPAAGQDPPTFEAELEVREVLLDVVVTDGDGNVIVGLGADDFVVEEEGEPVAIESVTFYSSRRFLGEVLPGSEGRDGAPEDRWFVLLFDRPRPGHPESALRLRRAGSAAVAWWGGRLLPSDWIGVLGWGGGFRLHSDFSRSPERLPLAIERAAGGVPTAEPWPSRQPVAEAPGASLETLAVASGDRSGGAGDPWESLAELAAELRSIRGRKVVVLFAEEFPEVDPAKLPRQSQARRRAAIEQLNDADVAVYTLSLPARGRVYELERLATSTGGLHFFDRDLGSSLDRISRENSGYYLVGYRARHLPEAAGYRRVVVRAVNPELEVRGRGGYLR